MTWPRIAVWVRDTTRAMGWRDVGYGVAVGLLFGLLGPHGGAIFVTGPTGLPLHEPREYVKELFAGVATLGLPLVFAVRVADRAVAEAVPRWLAYGAALLAVCLVRHLYQLTPLAGSDPSAVFPARIAWGYMWVFLQGGIGLVIYARWRASQQSMRLVQANETQRAQTAQRLQSARLLALQARVDPQLLFDSLGRVGVLQRRDPAAAEALLSDLIAMLRAMLPGETALTSTVEREFAVIDSWLRVTGALSSVRADVVLHAAPETAQCHLAPLLALPLLRAVLEAPGAGAVPWRLDAVAAGGRLLITLGAASATETRAADVLARADLTALRERLSSLHGDAAKLWLAQPPKTVTLDVPFATDEGDAIGSGPDEREPAVTREPLAQGAA
jgi:hypothetical protein